MSRTEVLAGSTELTDRPQSASGRSLPTRAKRAWAAMTFGLVALVVVLVFAIQNLKTVEVTFLSMHWQLPLAIQMLLVAVLGGLIVFAFGAARIVQLRVEVRRSRRRG